MKWSDGSERETGRPDQNDAGAGSPGDIERLQSEVKRLRDIIRDYAGITKSCMKEIRQLQQLRLTSKEREAIKVAASDYEDNDMDAGCWHAANTLRCLLARHFPHSENPPLQENEPTG